MKLNYVVICYKDNEDDTMDIKHICGYENLPTNTDRDSLIKELAEDESHGLIGDDDYKMKVLNRNIPDEASFLDYLEIPEEIDTEEKE